jgi:hypothetical protein
MCLHEFEYPLPISQAGETGKAREQGQGVHRLPSLRWRYIAVFATNGCQENVEAIKAREREGERQRETEMTSPDHEADLVRSLPNKLCEIANCRGSLP